MFYGVCGHAQVWPADFRASFEALYACPFGRDGLDAWCHGVMGYGFVSRWQCTPVFLATCPLCTAKALDYVWLCALFARLDYGLRNHVGLYLHLLHVLSQSA